MKIAFLSFYSGEMYRGVETFVHELANRLVDMGHDVTVYQNGSLLVNSKYKTVSIGIRVDWEKGNSYIPFVNYYARIVRKFTKIALKNLDTDTDILFPTNGQWQSALCKLWTIRHKKKLVISGQSGPGFDDRLNILTFPDVFVALTSFQKQWAIKANRFVNVEKIPNGVDLNKFSPKKGNGEIGLQRPIVLCVGAFDFWKRQDLSIRAVSKLKKGSLFLVGKGAKEEQLKKLGEKLLPGRFKIAAFPHSEMPRVFASCDVFTYPTVPWESFGIVIAEAMASGLPVVATNDPIRKEIAGNAGILVDPTDTQAYARALQEALDRKWGDKPRKQAERFDWDKIAIKYEQLFKTL